MRMTWKEIESYFNNNKIDDLLKRYSQCFEDVDKYEELLQKHSLDTILSVREAIAKLSGLYMSMRKPLSISITAIENGRARHYHDLKIKFEKEHSGEKFISAPIEKEANLLVAPFRRARNLFEGYVDSCEKSIGSCQSLLNSLNKEKGLPQGWKGNE